MPFRNANFLEAAIAAIMSEQQRGDAGAIRLEG
jgi:hypothetical protein